MLNCTIENIYSRSIYFYYVLCNNIFKNIFFCHIIFKPLLTLQYIRAYWIALSYKFLHPKFYKEHKGFKCWKSWNSIQISSNQRVVWDGEEADNAEEASPLQTSKDKWFIAWRAREWERQNYAKRISIKQAIHFEQKCPFSI